jgi:hypothetical protein
MQTFLPYEDFQASAEVLDYRRLGKQRVETWQILRALAGETKGWTNHPASKMWRGHETLLAEYGMVMCREWIRRGYNDTMLQRFEELLESTTQRHDEVDPDPSDPSDPSDPLTSQRRDEVSPGGRPEWLGRPEFHRSHQSNLIRKDPEYYGPVFAGVPSDLEYVWPV